MGASAYSDSSRIGLGSLPPQVPSGPTRRLDPVDAQDPWNSPTSVGLEWGPITGQVLGVSEYVLYLDQGLGQEAQSVYRGPLSEARAENLIPGYEYGFEVAAINYNGEGGRSPKLYLRSCVAPIGVLAPTLFSSSTLSLKLRWS